MCGGSQVPVSVNREGSDRRNAAVKFGGSPMMEVGEHVVVEGLTAGLVVVVVVAAVPGCLNKAF
jgi:hypothetical protein